MISFVVGLLIIGLVAGFIARALVPGRDPMSVPATIMLGIVGSFVGGFLADVFFRDDTHDRGLNAAGLLGSIVGAVVALLIWRTIDRRSLHRGLR